MTVRAVATACFFFAAGSSSLRAADIVPLAGKPSKGTVTGIDAQFVSYKDDTGMEQKVPVKELAAVDLGNKVVAPSGAYDEVELTDGSLFRVSDFRIKGKAVLIKPAVADAAGGLDVQLPLNTVFYWVRRANDGPTRNDWRKDVIAKRGKRDMLVLRVAGEKGDVFQPLEGSVLEGNADGSEISFEPAGGATKQPYSLGRISGGLLFNQPQPAVIPPTACKVLDVFGNVLFAQAVTVAGEKVTVKTVSGATVEYKQLAAVAKFDFSQGNVKYLADLEPVLDAPPPVEGEPNLTYLNNKTPSGPGLRVGGKGYAKGVWVGSEVAVTYKLDGEYREFKAMFGIDDSVPVAAAAVKVVVEADGRPLLTQTLRRKDGKAVEVNLNVKDAKVLKISVDRDSLYTGGALSMADARFQK